MTAQQGQQSRGIVAGALQTDHQGVFAGFAAQFIAEALHQISQLVAAEITAASAEQARQQLGPASLARGIGCAAATDPEPGGENRRPLAAQHRRRAAAGQLEALGLGQKRKGCGAAHAGRASRRQARSGASSGSSSAPRRSTLQRSSSSRGWLQWLQAPPEALVTDQPRH